MSTINPTSFRTGRLCRICTRQRHAQALCRLVPHLDRLANPVMDRRTLLVPTLGALFGAPRHDFWRIAIGRPAPLGALDCATAGHRIYAFKWHNRAFMSRKRHKQKWYDDGMSTTDSASFRSGLDSGRSRQKTHTRRLLLETTARLLAAGGSPTVTEVADAAGVSRRTAYRYFESSKRLHADAALEKLRPAMESAIDASASGKAKGGIEARVDALVESMQRLALENELLLRTMIHETVLTPAAGNTQRRGSRRLEWIESAVEPLRQRLAPTDYKRVVSALALCTGIEALLVLRDICCLTPGEATRVSQWMCRAIVRQSLSGRTASRVKKRARVRKSS